MARVCCDAAYDTDIPTCFEVLVDLGTNVRRIGRFACGLWVDVLEPGPVGAGGLPLVAVGGDAADVPVGVDHGPPKYRWMPQMATRPNACVRVSVSVSRVPAGRMER